MDFPSISRALSLPMRTETGKRALVRSGEDFDGVVGEPEARLAQ